MAIVDMHLPNILEAEAVGRALRAEFGPALPILAMSASREEQAAERIGAYAFLRKPFEIDDLLDLVRRGLELSERSYRLQRRSEHARERLAQAVERQNATFEANLDRKEQSVPLRSIPPTRNQAHRMGLDRRGLCHL